MKLSARYSRANVLTSLIILLITAQAYYLVIHYILTEQLNKDLVVEEQEVLAYVRLYKTLPPEGNFKGQIVRYDSISPKTIREFSDSQYPNTGEHQNEPARKLTTFVNIKNKSIKVEILKSKVESEELVRIIFLITLSIIFLLLVSLALVNRFMLNRLWRPFYITLSQLRLFNVADNQPIYTEDTHINEFDELNQAVKTLTSRVKKDYNELKSFTDNASHEMMTPLAVIQSKLDTLLQTGSFTQNQGELLEDIYGGLRRLSRLNQSLLLMAKIENDLIPDDKNSIALNELLLQKINQFQELIEAKGLQVLTELEYKKIQMSHYLVDILLNNLISNAIRHNTTGGVIKITLTKNELCIENSGRSESLNSETIFERFAKDNASEGMGLGLAISKQICAHSGLRLAYEYVSQRHRFIVYF